MEIYEFTLGTIPLVMSIPHVGEYIPPDTEAQMTSAAAEIGDTDWYLDRLYKDSATLGLHVLKATHSRYVIDLNRAPDNVSLYPGQNVTELVPTSTFAEAPLYPAGQNPDDAEIARRLEIFWHPYHTRLRETLTALKDKFGYAILFDCHSIKSVVPRFFDGRLPDFNLGTAAGKSCATDLRDKLSEALSGDGRYTLAVDGRFKGGYITRQYGDPNNNIHAFQLELSTATYMDEEPAFAWREDLANQVKPSLIRMLEVAADWRPA
ncbi:MAG: N-formylglutamate deformylase [Rhodospirillales bacterium]|nr:N-formylglutamate deformylase [Rhodospirillales bacterium]